jgi:hypothetical protein
VSKRPLFSTYSQGENRVTGSMLAVFERLDLATLERILRGATEESSLELVRFDLVKPEGRGTVPDGRIAASFKYLFEVKTAYDALRGEQLRGHLGHLEEPGYADCRLFAVTPDGEEPPVISALGDERLRWFSFGDLSRAIDAALSAEGVPDDERILLRELQILFAQEGLLGRQDVVVVAARHAYDFYKRWDAYVCQAGRAFRPGVTRLGFYRKLRIEPEFPTILLRRDDVVFSHDNAATLRATGDDLDDAVATLIYETLAAGSRIDGHPYQVFLLTPAQDERTLVLGQPIDHRAAGRGGAWTMGQRYVYSERLLRNPRTTVDLSGPGAPAPEDAEA